MEHNINAWSELMERHINADHVSMEDYHVAINADHVSIEDCHVAINADHVAIDACHVVINVGQTHQRST